VPTENMIFSSITLKIKLITLTNTSCLCKRTFRLYLTKCILYVLLLLLLCRLSLSLRLLVVSYLEDYFCIYICLLVTLICIILRSYTTNLTPPLLLIKMGTTIRSKYLHTYLILLYILLTYVTTSILTP